MALVMPILVPLGDFAGVDRTLVVTTYNAIGGLLLLVIPTNALLVAGRRSRSGAGVVRHLLQVHHAPDLDAARGDPGVLILGILI